MALVNLDKIDLGVEMSVHDVADAARVVLRGRVFHEETVFGSWIDKAVFFDQSAFCAADFAVFVIDDDVTSATKTNHLVRNDQVVHL